MTVGPILMPIWNENSTKSRPLLHSWFLGAFCWRVNDFLSFCWPLGGWKTDVTLLAKRCFAKQGNMEKHCVFPMKIKGRKRRNHSKKERERQLDTPKSHSQHLKQETGRCRSNFVAFRIHLRPQDGYKIQSRSNSGLHAVKNRPKWGEWDWQNPGGPQVSRK